MMLQTLWPEQSWENRGYGYDALNRLTSASGPWGEMGFTYDAAGNRLTKTAGGMGETYSYLPGTNRLSGVYGEGGTDYYQYDDAGNRTSGGGKLFEYDPEGRLERCYEEGALAGEYTYNGLGQRVAKTVEGVTTLFVYDQDGRLILETEAGAEGAGREYLHRGDNRLAMYDIAGDAWYFFQNDPIGTPVAVTDADNRIVWEAVYLTCGEAAVNPASLIEFNMRFAGQYFDAETGLHYNYHRYYDPKTGRYLTPDPIGLAGGINLYAYVQNNPVNLVDPYGLTGLEATIGGAGAYAAGGSALAGAAAGVATAGVGIGAYALASWAIEGTPLCEGVIGDWVYDKLHPPANEMGKGERGWEKARGDDPFYGKDVKQLKDIEKNHPDPKVRDRAKKE